MFTPFFSFKVYGQVYGKSTSWSSHGILDVYESSRYGFHLKKVVSTTPPLIEVCMCVCDIQVCMDGLILCFHPSVADTSSKWKVLCIKKFADKPLERDSGRCWQWHIAVLLCEEKSEFKVRELCQKSQIAECWLAWLQCRVKHRRINRALHISMTIHGRFCGKSLEEQLLSPAEKLHLSER